VESKELTIRTEKNAKIFAKNQNYKITIIRSIFVSNYPLLLNDAICSKMQTESSSCGKRSHISAPTSSHVSARPRNLFKFQIARAAIKKSEFSARESDWWRRSRLTLSTVEPIFWHLLSNTHWCDMYKQTPKTNFELGICITRRVTALYLGAKSHKKC
jgi:hypothetical protein